ncbi:hypothetical protein SISSUDRAFT_990471 [Sistotremastrum suecicum HHB10207 ss-3]|uniref:TPR-like protein n=1 Tax=Sistotremastrum suecicum HHB10207 ss-3 TaxID=1314776 RepID=A0A166ALZ0_9AGAM|nr:hypothetical protein SISSUDRAFT_990471 [Sistotremastrum suecicum HHB10207 ss-3]
MGHNPYTGQFANHLAGVLSVLGRLLKYGAVGSITLVAASLITFEGTHLYVENFSLRDSVSPESDHEEQYGWVTDSHRWTAGTTKNAGTDPELSWGARHLVRAAWMCLNWNTNPFTSISVHNQSLQLDGSSQTLDIRLLNAQSYLAEAIKKSGNSANRSSLLTIRAEILETLGAPSLLWKADQLYEELESSLPADSASAAQIHSKRGDIAARLGQNDEAVKAWRHAIDMIALPSPTQQGQVPRALPKEPLAQRIIAQNLVSLSSFYSTNKRLPEALAVQSAALSLLSNTSQRTTTMVPPAQQLHELYLTHRAALLTLQHSEVTYALSKKPATPLTLLTQAASSSEHVARVLCDVHPDPLTTNPSDIPYPPSTLPVSFRFISSDALRNPAIALLRDARRSAAQAWNLAGILHEREGSKHQLAAFECYERALAWCGGEKAAEGTLESEWTGIWQNYVRMRETIMKAHK